jgi:hypothetical protein
MQYVRDRLLTPVIACLVLTQGCAHHSASIQGTDAPSDYRTLTVDMSKHVASTQEWSLKTSDCSDVNYFCLMIPTKMVLAFPRACQTALSLNPPVTRVGAFRGVAPAPHLAPPSGSYIIDAYPNVLLSYRSGLGITEVKVVRHSPFERDFNPSDYSNGYLVHTVDKQPLFACH